MALALALALALAVRVRMAVRWAVRRQSRGSEHWLCIRRDPCVNYVFENV